VSEINAGSVGTTYLRNLNLDQPFLRKAGTDEYYHSDSIGSVLSLTNLFGESQTSYSYEPFGKTSVGGNSTANPFQYAGRENDGGGLNYF
jgi:hypothetical protein